MLAERVKEWTEEWLRQGREQGREQGLELGLERGIERGRAEERALLCRMAERKFDLETAERLSGMLDRLSSPERLAMIGEWIIDCGTGAELLDRAETPRPPLLKSRVPTRSVAREGAQAAVSTVERRAREAPRGAGALGSAGPPVDERRDSMTGPAPREDPAPAMRHTAPGAAEGTANGAAAGEPTPRRAAGESFPVVLVSPYELGRQPFGLAEAAAVAARRGLSGTLHRPLARTPRPGGARRRGARRGPPPDAHRGAHRGRRLRPAPRPRAPRPARRVRAVRPGQRGLLPRARGRGGARRGGRAGPRRPRPRMPGRRRPRSR